MKYGAIRYEFEFSTGVWTDVADEVLGTVSCKFGIMGNGLLDRIASTGMLKFTLKNINNKYTPGHINCVSGFKTGVKFRVVFEYENKERTRFYGTVPADGIEIVPTHFINYTSVTVIDYMGMTAIHEIKLPTFAENKRIDEVVPLVIANMPIAPRATEYNTGQDTFANVFDTLKRRVYAMQELSKVALSELGYVYIKQSPTDDEVLAVDGRYTRSQKAFSKIYIWDEETDYLMTEGGDYLMTEGGDYLILESTFSQADAVFDNCMTSTVLSHAKNYANEFKVITYPRRVDSAANAVLFNLNYSIGINAGETAYVTGRFVDPDQEAESVAGISMVAPVATTDYLFNTASDGTGSNITADLVVVATYGTNGVYYSLTNNNASTGYVTFLQARGKGIYIYRPIEYVSSDDALITADGKITATVDMKYQNNPLVAKDVSGALLDRLKAKTTAIESVSFVANKTEYLLNAFIDLQIGDKIQVTDDDVSIDAEYFIQNLSFTIDRGDIVRYTYGLAAASSMPGSAYWLIGTVGKSEIGTKTILGY